MRTSSSDGRAFRRIPLAARRWRENLARCEVIRDLGPDIGEYERVWSEVTEKQ